MNYCEPRPDRDGCVKCGLDKKDFAKGNTVEVAGIRYRSNCNRVFDEICSDLSEDSEARVTDPDTGGEKGTKLAQLGAVCPRALMEVAKVAGFGAQKYARYNFLKGYDWALSYDALQRHLNAFWSGEDQDPESGRPHLAHAAWHCLALLAFQLRKLGKDTRPK